MRALRPHLAVVGVFVVSGCASQSPVSPTHEHIAMQNSPAAAVASAAMEVGKPTSTCPRGYDLGAFTFEQYVQLPRTQAAIHDGIVDEAALLAFLSSLDKNGNGLICAGNTPGFEYASRPLAEYLYKVLDDNVSAQ